MKEKKDYSTLAINLYTLSRNINYIFSIIKEIENISNSALLLNGNSNYKNLIYDLNRELEIQKYRLDNEILVEINN